MLFVRKKTGKNEKLKIKKGKRLDGQAARQKVSED